MTSNPPPPPPQPLPLLENYKQDDENGDGSKIDSRKVIYDYNNKIFSQQQCSHNELYFENYQQEENIEHQPRIVKPNGHFTQLNANPLINESEDDDEYDVEMDDYSEVEEINEENELLPLHNFKENNTTNRLVDKF